MHPRKDSLRANAATLLRGLRLALALTVASSCSSSELPQTQVLVNVEADPMVAASITEIRAFLYPPDATDEGKWTEDLQFAVRSEERGRNGITFPFSFGIAKGSEERFKLVIKGYQSSDPNAEPVIEQKAITGFLPDHKLSVTLSLFDACYQRASTCSGLTRTCVRSAAGSFACEAPPVLGLESPSSDGSDTDAGGRDERGSQGGAGAIDEPGNDTSGPEAGAASEASDDGGAKDGGAAMPAGAGVARDAATDSGSPATPVAGATATIPLARGPVTLTRADCPPQLSCSTSGLGSVHDMQNNPVFFCVERAGALPGLTAPACRRDSDCAAVGLVSSVCNDSLFCVSYCR